jgi:hypothetical protein
MLERLNLSRQNKEVKAMQDRSLSRIKNKILKDVGVVLRAFVLDF